MGEEFQTGGGAGPRRRCRFGRFELDLEGRQLLEDGEAVRITEQPLRMLILLVRQAGQVVERERMRAELWPDGAQVDFDAGLYSCLRRLRKVLGEQGGEAEYIATLPGQGYRFRAEVEWEGPGAPAAASPAGPAPLRSASEHTAPTWPAAPTARPPRTERPRPRGWWRWSAAAVLATAAVAGWGLRPAPEPRVLSTRPITTDSGIDLYAKPVRDRGYLYYLDRDGGAWDLMRTNGDPATAQMVAAPYSHMRLFGISPDGQQALLGSFQERDQPSALWIGSWPTPSAPLQRVGSIMADDAAWFPNGKQLVYSSQAALWRARPDGGGAEKLADLEAGGGWFSWSADGARLRFTAPGTNGQRGIWEWRPGEPVRGVPLPGAGGQCCGTWSEDGRYYLYSSGGDEHWNLWAVRDRDGWGGWSRPQGRQLTALPAPAEGVALGLQRESAVFFQLNWKEELERYDPATGQSSVQLPGRFAIHMVPSRDGRMLAYVDSRDATVWVAEANGTAHPRRLSAPGLTAAFPRWSPDGEAIAFGGTQAGGAGAVWMARPRDGSVRRLTPGGNWKKAEVSQPDWSPDGRQLVVAANVAEGKRERSAIVVVDLARGEWQDLAGSAGLSFPRWSPDGRYVAAISSDQRRLEVFRFADGRWQTVATGVALTGPEWSRDGRYLYSQDLLLPGEPVSRFAAGSWKPEAVAEFGAMLRGGVHRVGFEGVAADGALLLSVNRGFSDLIAAQLALP